MNLWFGKIDSGFIHPIHADLLRLSFCLVSVSLWTSGRPTWLPPSIAGSPSQLPLTYITSHLAQSLDVHAVRHAAASFSTISAQRQFPARTHCVLASSSKPAVDPERCCDATADHPGSGSRRWIVNSWVAQLKLINITLVTPWQNIFLRRSLPLWKSLFLLSDIWLWHIIACGGQQRPHTLTQTHTFCVCVFIRNEWCNYWAGAGYF